MMATYRQLLESLNLSEQNPKEHKPGDIWQTASGNWYGMRKDKDTGKPESQSYGHETNSKDKAQLYAKGGDPSTLDTKDDEEPKPEGPAPKKLNPQELKDKQVDDALIKQNSEIMDADKRIPDLIARAEWDLQGKEEEKEREMKRKPTGDELKEIGKAIREFRKYTAMMRESTNNKITYRGI